MAVGNGVAAPLVPGLFSLLLFLPNRLRPLNPKLLWSTVCPFPIKYAAVCNAVAAADRLAKWFLALCSFVDQSGLTLSVVITVEAFADIEIVRLLWAAGSSVGLAPVELIEVEEDIAEEKFSTPWFAFAYERPLLNRGCSYVTPNSGC